MGMQVYNLSTETNQTIFDAKVIINEIEPSVSDFDNLTSFNKPQY